MASRTLTSGLCHGDADGRNAQQLDSSGLDELEEPLLSNNGDACSDSNEPDHQTCKHLSDQGKKNFSWKWRYLCSHFISQCAQYLAKLCTGFGSVSRRVLSLIFTGHMGDDEKATPLLSPFQKERLRNLQLRLEVVYDGTRADHEHALELLWMLAYPDQVLPSLKSELWKEMGWQSPDPSSDFRAGGFMSLENLIFFARKYPDSFQRLLHKKDGKRSDWEYPFAAAGVNITFMLTNILDLQSGMPKSTAGIRFLELLGEDEMAFDVLYCITFQMMDSLWLAKHASYMEFNDVLKCTRVQLEHELSLENVYSIKDLPAYRLLCR